MKKKNEPITHKAESKRKVQSLSPFKHYISGHKQTIYQWPGPRNSF